MNKHSSELQRPDYGIDAPHVLLALTVSGLICALIALVAPAVRWLYSPAVSLLATSAIWLYGSKVGKLRLREKLLDLISLKGDEQVLDAGCGSGLLLNAAAKRLTSGAATGVDIWSSVDLSNNSMQKTLANATAEGVIDRVRVDDGDIRRLKYGAGTFDAVLSLNVIHNISNAEERACALREIIRVLKPGGQFVLCDFRNISEYVEILRTTDGVDAQKRFIGWVGFFPMFAAVGSKKSS